MCCNQSRQMASTSGQNRARSSAPRPGDAPPARGGSSAYFQYLGATGMMVRGPITGATYRFVHHGAIVGVDPGDSRGIAQVPGLRQVRGP